MISIEISFNFYLSSVLLIMSEVIRNSKLKIRKLMINKQFCIDGHFQYLSLFLGFVWFNLEYISIFHCVQILWPIIFNFLIFKQCNFPYVIYLYIYTCKMFCFSIMLKHTIIHHIISVKITELEYLLILCILFIDCKCINDVRNYIGVHYDNQ